MSAAPALLAVDQGTTSSRAILFSSAGDILSLHQKELKLHYPQKGWVEQNPGDIWHDTLQVCRAVIAEAAAQGVRVAAAGITNQRETTILWHRKTGRPVYNAIVWQDRRTTDLCARLKAAGHEPTIAGKTGLLLDPYFSASKIAWILDHVDGARAAADAGDLAFGTVDSFLLWHFSGGKIHRTDVTNASRTLLYNIVDQTWDDDLLTLFDIPRALLPEVCDNVHDFAVLDAAMTGADVPIGGVAGDQQAALIGQGCFKPGMVKSTYGTGCFALMNIGPDFRVSAHRLLTTPAYRIGGKISYAVEGSIFVAGAAVQWLRDGLGILQQAAESEAMARSVADNNGVYFVPALAGLGAPHWRPEAQGLLTGLTRESKAAHVVRAALEAQAYQTRDLMDAMAADCGRGMEALRADGGLVANDFVCQFLADMLDRPVEIPRVAECTAWGAACLAGLHARLFADVEAIAGAWRAHRIYTPQMAKADRAALYDGWRRAVAKALA